MSSLNEVPRNTNANERHECKVLHVRELNLGQRKEEEEKAEKEKFIRQWLLSHNKNEPISQTSSIFELPIFPSDHLLKSPILSNRRRRFKATLNQRNSITKHDKNNSCKQIDNKNSDTSITRLPSTPPSTHSNVIETSPIISRHSYKRRKRKLLQSFKSNEKTDETNVDTIMSKSSPIIISKRYIWRKEHSRRSLSKTFDETYYQTKNLEDSRIEQYRQSAIETDKLTLSPIPLPISQQIESIDSEEDEIKGSSIKDDDSDKTASDLIEDPCSQESDRCDFERTILLPHTVSINSLDSSLDLDKTFCSKAEGILRDTDNLRVPDEGLVYLKENGKIDTQTTNMGMSDKISQVSTYSNKITTSVLNESYMITNSSGSQSEENRSYFTMPNFLKKKRKPKKGSLNERIQKLISIEISSKRIWRHQLIQPNFQESSSQFTTLCIHQIYEQYSKQLLKCHVINDSYNLLSTLENIDSVSGLRKSINCITIVIISAVVGIFNAPKESFMKLYPPWEIIDKEQCLISASYFTIYSGKDKVDGMEEQFRTDKEVIIQEFDCPCLKANKIVNYCDIKFRNCKPNVIEKIFDFK